MVERLFLTVPWECLQFVIVVFPDHTHLLFLQSCPYAHTQPQRFQLYRLFSILWHLSLHLLDRVFSQSRNYDIMVLSDLAKGGLESGVWIDEYNNQNKDKY